jgi:hypothetical protein
MQASVTRYLWTYRDTRTRVITYLPPLFLFLQDNNYGDEMRAVGLSAQLQMPTFLPHHLLCCLLKSCSWPAPAL